MATTSGHPALNNRPVLHLAMQRSMRGGERQALWLHAGLLASAQESLLVCRTGSALSHTSCAHRQALRLHGFIDLFGWWRLWRLVRQIHPALIHCHDSLAFSLGSVLGRLCAIDVITTRRVIFAIRPSFFNRWKYRHSAHVVAVSQAVADQVRLVAPRTPVTVIGDGVRWQDPGLDKEAARKFFHLAPDHFCIGSVAHFTAEKNFPQLVRLARTLATTHPRARLVCIGPLDRQCRALAAPLSNLIALGELTDATRYYQAFDAYVSTATSEGLGSALLDAVVRDIPCVALDAGGTRDLFTPGYPLLIDRQTPQALIPALVRLIDDREAFRPLCAQQGIRARTIFSVDAMVAGYQRLYEAIRTGRTQQP